MRVKLTGDERCRADVGGVLSVRGFLLVERSPDFHLHFEACDGLASVNGIHSLLESKIVYHLTDQRASPPGFKQLVLDLRDGSRARQMTITFPPEGREVVARACYRALAEKRRSDREESWWQKLMRF